MRSSAFALIVAAFVLSGCGFTETGDAFRTVIADKGAKAMDEGLANAEWFMCNAVSVGAVRRRYGHSPKLSFAYDVLCSRDQLLPLVPTPGSVPAPSEPPGEIALSTSSSDSP